MSRYEVREHIACDGYGVFDTRRQTYTSFPVGSSGMLRRKTHDRQVAENEAMLKNIGL